MANREHVKPWRPRRFVVLALVAFAYGCSGSADPIDPPMDFRGRVIDSETGQGIAGAIVVGKYVSSNAYSGHAACDRIEGAIADADGWFTLPFDPKWGGLPLMEAYHRAYGRGYQRRYAVNGIGGVTSHWQVWEQKRDDNDRVVSLVKEPKIYNSEAEALEASRQWKDVYLKQSKGSREDRLRELWRLSGAGICGGGAQTSLGPRDFFKAIYAEQVELGDSAGRLAVTLDEMALAESARKTAGRNRP